MQANRTVHVCVPLCGIKEELDTAAGLLPLVTDYRLHDVALGLFVASEHRGGSVFGFQLLAGAIEKFFVGDQVPIWLLILQFDLY